MEKSFGFYKCVWLYELALQKFCRNVVQNLALSPESSRAVMGEGGISKVTVSLFFFLYHLFIIYLYKFMQLNSIAYNKLLTSK